MTVLELCIQDLAGVQTAHDAGFDRVELCRDLSVGGLTPGDELIAQALEVGIDIQVLIRPRAGNFAHSKEEISKIVSDIKRIKNAHEDVSVNLGFVVGALLPNGRVNVDAARRFRSAAGSSPLTFHRAFDETPDVFQALDELLELGYDRILTTGGNGAVADPTRLRELQEHAQDALTILASGGLRSHNVAQIVRQSQAREVHMRAPGPRGTTDPIEARKIVQAMQQRETR
ncbi:MAG: copper homeostasis protein CutC [Actinomycetaceae bacterium]|nr:copper homeostasis protein CutC [Actinomycetaceae bacterium]